jgi:hypothetical protein
MISQDQFGKLRLAQFRPEADIVELADWEFMDELWVGEAVGFSEWLRLQTEPMVLRSLAVDFTEFPEAAALAVLQTIELPIQRGMSDVELKARLGEPVEEFRFVADRITYKFAVPGPHRYNVSCTVLKQGGLSYLVVMHPLT